MYIAKWKQIHRHRKQTNGYQGRQERGQGQVRAMVLRDTNYYLYIDKQQGYAVQHGELQSLFCNNF